MSIYILAKKSRLREKARRFNSKNPFSLARTNTGSLKSGCVSTVESKPIIQTGYGIRNRLLTTTRTRNKVFKKMPDNLSSDITEEKKSENIVCVNQNNGEIKPTNISCSTSSSAPSSLAASGNSGKSLNSSINRLKTCVITKDPPVARTAGQHIEKIKANIKTCEEANPKPAANSKCTTSV